MSYQVVFGLLAASVALLISGMNSSQTAIVMNNLFVYYQLPLYLVTLAACVTACALLGALDTQRTRQMCNLANGRAMLIIQFAARLALRIDGEKPVRVELVQERASPASEKIVRFILPAGEVLDWVLEADNWHLPLDLAKIDSTKADYVERERDDQYDLLKHYLQNGAGSAP